MKENADVCVGACVCASARTPTGGQRPAQVSFLGHH